jgi:hypothetical protein
MNNNQYKIKTIGKKELIRRQKEDLNSGRQALNAVILLVIMKEKIIAVMNMMNSMIYHMKQKNIIL